MDTIEKLPETRLSEEAMASIEKRISDAVRTGIREAITEDAAQAFWSAGFAVLQKQAADHAGRFVLGGLVTLVRKALLFMAFGSVFYALGGWNALSTFFKLLFMGKP